MKSPPHGALSVWIFIALVVLALSTTDRARAQAVVQMDGRASTS